MQSAGQRNGRRAGRNRGDDRAGKPVERPSRSPLPPESLVGATCNPDLLPPGRAVLYGEHVRFVPPQATVLLPPGCVWQGSLLGKLCGGTLDAAPRLRVLMQSPPDAASSLVLDDVADITALLSGQSRQTGLNGREAGLWWRDLPLGRIVLKQGRAIAGFK